MGRTEVDLVGQEAEVKGGGGDASGGEEEDGCSGGKV